MIELCYVSSASDRFTKPDLIKLLNEARTHNFNAGMTGLLLYDEVGTFIQVIEGEEGPVSELYERIKQDPRHRRVNKISQKKILEPSFKGWEMGFRTLKRDQFDSNQGISDFLYSQKNTLNVAISNNPSVGLNMIYHFKTRITEEAQDSSGI